MLLKSSQTVFHPERPYGLRPNLAVGTAIGASAKQPFVSHPATSVRGWFADVHGCAMICSMPEIARATVGLRIFGDALDPDEITRLLGVAPTGCAHKGDTRRMASGREVVAQSGSWRLDADLTGNLNTQIGALLTQLPSDPTIWRELTDHYECDVFCGLFMREGTEGMELSPEAMSMLGVRGLRLGLDIYGGTD